jgi:hypothetical protein
MDLPEALKLLTDEELLQVAIRLQARRMIATLPESHLAGTVDVELEQRGYDVDYNEETGKLLLEDYWDPATKTLKAKPPAELGKESLVLTKTCVTCLHFLPCRKSSDPTGEYGKCSKVKSETPNLVVGGMTVKYGYAESERGSLDSWHCGPAGRLWEPKEMDTLRICLGLGVYPDGKEESQS